MDMTGPRARGPVNLTRGKSGTLTEGTGLQSLVFWPHAIKSPLMDWVALNEVYRRTPKSILN